VFDCMMCSNGMMRGNGLLRSHDGILY
jgi:hypothetical protein